MSTVIADGWRLKVASLAAFHRFLDRFRAAATAKSREIVASAVARHAADTLDRRALGWFDANGTSAFVDAWRRVEHAFRKVKLDGERNPAFDFEFEACILPGGRRPLVIVYTEQEAYREVWASMPETESYPYWDNTDRPDGVTASEWRRRARAWDRALGPTGVPARRGHSFELIGLNLAPPTVEEVVAALPDPGARLRQLAADKLIMQARPKDWAETAALVRRYAGEEGMAEIEAEVRALSDVVKPDLDAEDLVAQPPAPR